MPEVNPRASNMTGLRQCPHGYHHPDPFHPTYPHPCDGCWCEGERDKRDYGWPHSTEPTTERTPS